MVHGLEVIIQNIRIGIFDFTGRENKRYRKTELIDKLYDLELKIDQVFSPIIHNIVEWEGLEETPFYQHVLREGKAI